MAARDAALATASEASGGALRSADDGPETSRPALARAVAAAPVASLVRDGIRRLSDTLFVCVGGGGSLDIRHPEQFVNVEVSS